MAQETEKSFPCDAEVTETGYDKEYVAEDFARYFQAFISSGIFMKEDTNLQVIANGDMTVTLKAGKMIIDGYRYDSTGDIIITIDPADGVLGRIDRISATWCKDEGDIHYTLQKGTPSYKPVAPECRRTEEYKDYVVADIYVAAGVIKIQQQNITDQRLNSDVCGLAIPFTELNTDAIFTQYQDAVNEFLKFADTCIDSTVVGQIEADLANKLDKTGDSGDNVVAFTQTASRQNIMTGDTHKTIFGKIKKWLADLTATAFAQMITTKEDLLATKVTGYVPDAKAVADAVSDVNGKLIIKDVAVKALTGYSFIGDAFCENGITRISGSMSAAAAIKTAEWVKFLQIEDPQFYPTHPSQFPCTTYTQGNGAVFAGYINVLTDGGIYVYTRSESIIGSRFFVEFR